MMGLVDLKVMTQLACLPIKARILSRPSGLLPKILATVLKKSGL